MRRLAIAVGVLVAKLVITSPAQEKPKTDHEVDVKRCSPKVVSHAPRAKQTPIRTRKGEKSTGFSPVIAFQILASGEVAHAYLKRSSRIADIDTHALNWIQGTKYNARSGCEVIETEASVSIHWVSR